MASKKGGGLLRRALGNTAADWCPACNYWDDTINMSDLGHSSMNEKLVNI